MQQNLMVRLDLIEQKLDSLHAASEQLFTTEQAAEFLGVSIDKFRRIHTQVAPSYKLARRIMFKKSELVSALPKFISHLSDNQVQEIAQSHLRRMEL